MAVRPRPLAFDHTLAVAGTPEELVTCAGGWLGRISLRTTHDVLLEFDGDGTPTQGDEDTLTLLAGEAYAESDISLSHRISFVNINPDERPRVRGIMWGRKET